MTIESVECVAAILVGAITMRMLVPDWWMALGIALAMLGPANLGLTVLLRLGRRDADAMTPLPYRVLVVVKIIVAVVLLPLLICCVLLLAVFLLVAWAFVTGARLNAGMTR